MKKNKAALIFMSSLLSLTLFGCTTSSNTDTDNELSNFNLSYASVFALYADEAIITYDSDFDLKNQVFYSKAIKDQVVSTLIPGDTLNIYSNESAVKHVFVEEAKIIEIEIRFGMAPGSKEIEIYTDLIGIVIDYSNILYIITNNEGDFYELHEYTLFTKFYGTYNPSNNINTTEFTTLISLDAVYSFQPRGV